MNHLSSLLFNEPLMIAPGKLDAILNGFSQELELHTKESHASSLQILGKKETYAVVDGTAIIPVQGTLVHKLGYLDAMSGITNYVAITNMVEKAMDDPMVNRLILDCNSGGGSVNGAFDAADIIYNFRGEKPMDTLVDEHCYSAAILLGSATDRIIVTRTSGIGSVGVVTAHKSRSRKNEKEGYDVEYIISGAKKVDGAPDLALSERARKDMQGRSDYYYEMFVDTIARNRDLKASVVKGTEAGIYLGRHAVEAGFADEVKSVNQFIQETISK